MSEEHQLQTEPPAAEVEEEKPQDFVSSSSPLGTEEKDEEQQPPPNDEEEKVQDDVSSTIPDTEQKDKEDKEDQLQQEAKKTQLEQNMQILKEYTGDLMKHGEEFLAWTNIKEIIVSFCLCYQKIRKSLGVLYKNLINYQIKQRLLCLNVLCEGLVQSSFPIVIVLKYFNVRQDWVMFQKRKSKVLDIRNKCNTYIIQIVVHFVLVAFQNVEVSE